jgi:cell division septum initiation protein DivIVA
MSIDDLNELIKERSSLPVVMRGYDRSATDELLGKLEGGLRSILTEHSDAQLRLAELEERVAAGREQEQAITEALVVAARVRAESEREGKELKATYVREAEAVKAESAQQAEEIVRAAEVEAERIVEDARLKARGFEQEIRDAEQLAEQTRARLTSFLESLLAEIERRGADLASAVDDLLVRAGDAAKGGREQVHSLPE